MPLPGTVRVKISSEAAEYVALTPVVVRELPLLELLEHIVGATGPEPARVRDILRRGSIVSGYSRLRWQGCDASEDDLAGALAELPAPDPSRPFLAARCVRAVLCGPGVRLDIPREAAQQKRIFRRASFWDALLAAAALPGYVTYHYRERADLYRTALSAVAVEQLRAAAALLRYPDLARQIRAARIDSVEWVVMR